MPPWLVLTLGTTGPALVRFGESRATLFESDPRLIGSSNTRFLGGLGALPGAALAFFANPLASRKADAFTFQVVPMFALGGAGLSLRCTW